MTSQIELAFSHRALSQRPSNPFPFQVVAFVVFACVSLSFCFCLCQFLSSCSSLVQTRSICLIQGVIHYLRKNMLPPLHNFLTFIMNRHFSYWMFPNGLNVTYSYDFELKIFFFSVQPLFYHRIKKMVF